MGDEATAKAIDSVLKGSALIAVGVTLMSWVGSCEEINPGRVDSFTPLARPGRTRGGIPVPSRLNPMRRQGVPVVPEGVPPAPASLRSARVCIATRRGDVAKPHGAPQNPPLAADQAPHGTPRGVVGRPHA
jgi:hypothetical protein